jgi:hypothetical protein
MGLWTTISTFVLDQLFGYQDANDFKNNTDFLKTFTTNQINHTPNDNAYEISKAAMFVFGAIQNGNKVLGGLLVSAGVGLNIDYTAGNGAGQGVWVNSTLKQPASGSSAVTSHSLNYVYVDSAGTVTIVANTIPTGQYAALAVVETNATTITKVRDVRGAYSLQKRETDAMVKFVTELDILAASPANNLRGHDLTSALTFIILGLVFGGKIVGGLVPTDAGGLNVNWTTGEGAANGASISGTIYHPPAGSGALAANSENYVYVDTTGTVKIAQTAPGSLGIAYAPMVYAITGASTITRFGPVGGAYNLSIYEFSNFLTKQNLYLHQPETKNTAYENGVMAVFMLGAIMNGNKILGGLSVSDAGGLSVQWTAGTGGGNGAKVGGTTYQPSAGSASVTANSINYVYVNNAGNVVVSTAIPYGSQYAAMAIAETNSTSIFAPIRDVRGSFGSL